MHSSMHKRIFDLLKCREADQNKHGKLYKTADILTPSNTNMTDPENIAKAMTKDRLDLQISKNENDIFTEPLIRISDTNERRQDEYEETEIFTLNDETKLKSQTSVNSEELSSVTSDRLVNTNSTEENSNASQRQIRITAHKDFEDYSFSHMKTNDTIKSDELTPDEPIKRNVMFTKAVPGHKKTCVNNILINVSVNNYEFGPQRENSCVESKEEILEGTELLLASGGRRTHVKKKFLPHFLLGYEPLGMSSQTVSEISENLSDASSEFCDTSDSETLHSCMSQYINVAANETAKKVVHLQKSKTVRTVIHQPELESNPQSGSCKFTKPPSFHHKQMHHIEGGFENMTDYNLSHDVKVLLSLGYTFTCQDMYTLAKFLRSYHIDQNTEGERCFYLTDYMKQSYRKMYAILNKQDTPQNRGLIKTLEKAIEFLQQSKDVCILHRICSNGLVLVNSNECLQRLDAWVEKGIRCGIYEELSHQEDLKKWQTVWYIKYQRYHRELSDKVPYQIKEVLDDLNKPNLPLPFLYAVVKKSSESEEYLLPVFNTNSWYIKGLEHVIKYYISLPYSKSFSTRSLTKIASDIRNTKAKEGFSFVKVNIDETLTSINTTDVIYAFTRIVYSKSFQNANNINPDLLVDILETWLHSMMVFEHRGKVFRQVKGLAQGSRSSNILATLLLQQKLQVYNADIFSQLWVSKTYMFHSHLLLYMRTNCIVALLEKLEKYTNMKFSAELENCDEDHPKDFEQHIISFIDIDIVENLQGKFLTKVHRNRNIQHTNVMQQALINVPDNWKIAIIDGHLQRVLERASNNFLAMELYYLEHHFEDKLYPQIVIRSINRYIGNLRLLRSHEANNIALGNITSRVRILESYVKSLQLLHPNLYCIET